MIEARSKTESGASQASSADGSHASGLEGARATRARMSGGERLPLAIAEVARGGSQLDDVAARGGDARGVEGAHHDGR